MTHWLQSAPAEPSQRRHAGRPHRSHGVATPSRFTLEFGRDGRAVLRLDCNRGMGDYKVMPAGDGTSGSLTFGPIAGTRARCAPPHLDERVARDLPYVRSYLLEDGKLFLSLMADAASTSGRR